MFEKHTYLSPHLDDVAWSAGGVIARLRARGRQVDVVTVCAGVPPATEPAPPWFAEALRAAGITAHELVVARREEDGAAMRVLDATYEWSQDLDAVFRLPEKYDSFPRLLGTVAEDDPLVHSVATLIRRMGPGVLLHAPLGVGGHVDHRIVSDGAWQAARPVVFYEDFPYVVEFPGALERRLADLGGRLVPLVVDVSMAFDQRSRAMRAYASQLGSSSEEVIRKAEDYAQVVGHGLTCERVWVLPEWLSLVKTAIALDS